MTRHVRICMETSLRISRGILTGITDYVRLHGGWKISYTAGGWLEQRIPVGEHFDGVIARITSSELARDLVAFRGPIVLCDPSDPYLAPSHPLSRRSAVSNDYDHCGRLAAEYFLSCGYRHFASVGPTYASAPGLRYDKALSTEPNWSRERREGFAVRLGAEGFSCEAYQSAANTTKATVLKDSHRRLVSWLRKLPKPVGILTAHDARGVQLVEACAEAGLSVPDEVGVLGVNGDPLLCATCDPPLASVAIDAVGAGFRAAEILDKLMNGSRQDPVRCSYPALKIDAAGSTGDVHAHDPLVRQAQKAIRSQPLTGLHPEALAKSLGLSRRSLELKFSHALGRGIAAVIRDEALARAHRLVEESAMPFSGVAESCGIATASHLAKLFRQAYGKTMSATRRDAHHVR